MPISPTTSIIELDSSPEPIPRPDRRRTRSQGPASPPHATNASPKRKAPPPSTAHGRTEARTLGPVIELTDSDSEEDAELPRRLAPKPKPKPKPSSQANAVASGSGTRHSDAEDAESEVEVVDYDPA